MITTAPITPHGDAELVVTMPDGTPHALTVGDVADMDQWEATLRDWRDAWIKAATEKPTPQPVETIRDCICCDTFAEVAGALTNHVVIEPVRNEFPLCHYPFYEMRTVGEVIDSRVWVKLIDCAATPNKVQGVQDGLAWEAELVDFRWQPDGLLVEYAIGRAF